MLLSFVSHESHGKATSTLVSKLDYRASVPMLERRFFLRRFTPFHLQFRHLLPVFQNNEARGGIRRNRSEDLSQVSRRAVLSPRAERGSWDQLPLFRSAFVGIGANEKDRLDDEKGTVNSFAQRILRYHEKKKRIRLQVCV